MQPQAPRYRSGSLSIDPLESADLPIFRELLDEMVDSLNMADIYTVEDSQLHEALFGVHPQFEAVIARFGGKPAGVATWTHGFHVIRGQQVMSFEYLYVRPEFRNHMVPIALLLYVLVLARRRGYFRIEGFVEEWNDQTAQLYKKLQAEAVDQKLWRLDLNKVDWTPYRNLLGPNTV